MEISHSLLVLNCYGIHDGVHLPAVVKEKTYLTVEVGEEEEGISCGLQFLKGEEVEGTFCVPHPVKGEEGEGISCGHHSLKEEEEEENF